MTLRTLNYGNYGIFLVLGNAGFCPSTVLLWLMRELLGESQVQQPVSQLEAPESLIPKPLNRKF